MHTLVQMAKPIWLIARILCNHFGWVLGEIKRGFLAGF